jgi:ABC-type sugar transport system ATPase subunit
VKDTTVVERQQQAVAAVVSAAGLTKRFGAGQVLTDVSLTIRPGEILVLLGPNGAGKSTLLSIIGGTLAPSEGSLSLDGHPVQFPRPQSDRHAGSDQGRVLQRS